MIYTYIDCDKTQEYVFSSRRLRGIRNGSRLIDKADQEVGKLAVNKSGEPIRALGGVVVAKFPDPGDANVFLKEAEIIYNRYGISITAAQVSCPSVNNFYDDVLMPLLSEVREKKDCPKEKMLPPPGSILAATCAISGRYSAQGLVEIAPSEPLQRASAVEITKWNAAPQWKASSKDLDKQANDLVATWEKPPAIPSTIEDIIDWRSDATIADKDAPGTSEARTLGIIFADVNGVGKLLPQVSRDENKYKDFSAALKSCLFTSLQQALQQVLEKPVNLANDARFPFRLLFLGGDDLCYAVAGAYALPLTQRFIECFEKLSVDILQPLFETTDETEALPSHLTISAGAVVAPYKYPILSFRRLGQGLESHAKKYGRYWADINNEKYPPSLIDYHIVKSDMVGAIEEIRQQMYKIYTGNSDKIALFGGPYLAGENIGNSQPAAKRFLPLDNLLKAAESLLQIKAGSKLKNLRLILSRQDAPILYREWWDHLDDAEEQFKKACEEMTCIGLNTSPTRDKLPINDYPHLNTPLLDALEIMSLVALRNKWEV